MKNKFKVGDRVKIISNEGGSRHPVGTVGFVTEVDIDCTCLVNLTLTEEGGNNWSAIHEIELFPSVPGPQFYAIQSISDPTLFFKTNNGKSVFNTKQAASDAFNKGGKVLKDSPRWKRVKVCIKVVEEA